MPTLSPEPVMLPESLFDQQGDGQWWVLHVKPRAEKALARRCHARSAGFFLPVFRRVRRTRGRVKDSYLPLFPGYLFLFGKERDRLIALETNLVVNVLPVPDQQELYDDLKRINAVMRSGLPMRPGQKLEPGTSVAIIDGPLVGMKGTVMRYKNKVTLILKVSFLQQGASVEIDSWMIEPIAKPPIR
jgi:transcription antitermination factor NusG